MDMTLDLMKHSSDPMWQFLYFIFCLTNDLNHIVGKNIFTVLSVVLKVTLNQVKKASMAFLKSGTLGYSKDICFPDAITVDMLSFKCTEIPSSVTPTDTCMIRMFLSCILN